MFRLYCTLLHLTGLIFQWNFIQNSHGSILKQEIEKGEKSMTQGFHFFPLCCYCLVAKSCLTLCDPLDYSPPDSSDHEISQGNTLEWVAISFSISSTLVRYNWSKYKIFKVYDVMIWFLDCEHVYSLCIHMCMCVFLYTHTLWKDCFHLLIHL